MARQNKVKMLSTIENSEWKEKLEKLFKIEDRRLKPKILPSTTDKEDSKCLKGNDVTVNVYNKGMTSIQI